MYRILALSLIHIYTVIDVQSGSMTIRISMKTGKQMSYHMHRHRKEIWTVVSGSGKAIVDGMEQLLHTGDAVSYTHLDVYKRQALLFLFHPAITDPIFCL